MYGCAGDGGGVPISHSWSVCEVSLMLSTGVQGSLHFPSLGLFNSSNLCALVWAVRTTTGLTSLIPWRLCFGHAESNGCCDQFTSGEGGADFSSLGKKVHRQTVPPAVLGPVTRTLEQGGRDYSHDRINCSEMSN